MMTNMNEEYLNWLYSFVGSDTREYGHYWRLMRVLYQREFYYIVKNDDNRAKDGVRLRYEFAADYQYPEELVSSELQGPCRVLEMLVALARRMNDEVMWDPEKGDRTAFWFWKIVGNLVNPLEKYDDFTFNSKNLLELHQILTTFLERKFQKNGVGGLFPVRFLEKNQQKIEIWYQMNYWLNENFPINSKK